MIKNQIQSNQINLNLICSGCPLFGQSRWKWKGSKKWLKIIKQIACEIILNKWSTSDFFEISPKIRAFFAAVCPNTLEMSNPIAKTSKSYINIVCLVDVISYGWNQVISWWFFPIYGSKIYARKKFDLNIIINVCLFLWLNQPFSRYFTENCCQSDTFSLNMDMVIGLPWRYRQNLWLAWEGWEVY